jgi:hypothetical protein
VSVRGLIGLIDHCSQQEDFVSRHPEELLLGLDLSRCVEGGIVPNWPLDFRQYSFTHVIQVSGLPLW